MTAGTGDGEEDRKQASLEGLRRIVQCGKPQPQVAPTSESPRCPHLQCAIDSFWHEYYTQELLKNRRILAAIKDNKLPAEVAYKNGINPFQLESYRAALLEHINAKENPNG